jgi:hypothetical protein
LSWWTVRRDNPRRGRHHLLPPRTRRGPAVRVCAYPCESACAYLYQQVSLPCVLPLTLTRPRKLFETKRGFFRLICAKMPGASSTPVKKGRGAGGTTKPGTPTKKGGTAPGNKENGEQAMSPSPRPPSAKTKATHLHHQGTRQGQLKCPSN